MGIDQIVGFFVQISVSRRMDEGEICELRVMNDKEVREEGGTAAFYQLRQDLWLSHQQTSAICRHGLTSYLLRWQYDSVADLSQVRARCRDSVLEDLMGFLTGFPN